MPHASMLRRPLIWRGVCPWDKSAITRSRRISSQSNRRFFGRRLAARAALSASSARYYPSGPVWRAISRHTTEGLRPIKWAIRTWDKPASTPAMIAARSSTLSIRRHPMISLQTASPLHENCLHPMTPPCVTPNNTIQKLQNTEYQANLTTYLRLLRPNRILIKELIMSDSISPHCSTNF